MLQPLVLPKSVPSVEMRLIHRIILDIFLMAKFFLLWFFIAPENFGKLTLIHSAIRQIHSDKDFNS